MHLRLLLFTLLCSSITLQAQNRYIDEVFDSVIVLKDNLYGANISIITGVPSLDSLYFDIYMPAGDTATKRPVALVLHTGTFLPRGLAAPTGDKDDYANIATCEKLAKRGYVAVSFQYRTGWNPQAPSDVERRAQLLQAAYRCIQDTYSVIRFLNMTVDEFANPYGLDTDKLAIYGIGTGGFIGANMIALDEWRTEIYIDKFRDPVYGVPFIDTTVLGDLENTKPGFLEIQGMMIPFNIPLHVGYKQDYHFAYGLDAGVGDSSWLDTGEPSVPMASIGVVDHPTTPFGLDPITGEINCDLPVFTGAGTEFFVVNIAGTACIARKANELGYNKVLEDYTFDDEISNKLRTYEHAQEHLWAISLPGQQAGPWEYWDSTFWKTVPSINPAFDNIHQAGIATNPDMSLEKANAYIDTAVQFFVPRACVALGLECGLTSGVRNLVQEDYNFSMYPNPAAGEVNFRVEGEQRMTRVTLYDMYGRLVNSTADIDAFNHSIDVSNIPPGVYAVRIELGEKGFLSTKLMVQN